MPGASGGLTLLAAVYQVGGFPGFPGHQSRENFGDTALFGAKPTADAGLCHPHFGFGDVQGVSDDTPGMKDDLGGTEHVQPPIGVHVGVGAEGLHHGLAVRFGMIGALQHHVAVGQHGLNVPVSRLLVGTQISPVICAHRTVGDPVILRVHQHRVILGRAEIQHGGEDLIGDFDVLQGPVHGLLRLTGHHSHGIPVETHVAVQQQTVIGAGFGIGLAGHGKPLLGHIFVGENGLDAGHLHGYRGVDVLNHGICMGAVEHLHHQGVGITQVVGVHRLAGDQGHGILFAYGLVDIAHYDIPPFWASLKAR